MFKCNRTNAIVSLSDVQGYVFYNPELDEDLLTFETYLDVSAGAKQEALELNIATIPANQSHNKELMLAVQGSDILDVLESVDNNTRSLEFCEAVLVQAFLNKS